MGINESAGKNYRMIKKALERIRTTAIKSVGTFYSKEGKQGVDDNFSLYNRIAFKGKELPNNEISDDNYLVLGRQHDSPSQAHLALDKTNTRQLEGGGNIFKIKFWKNLTIAYLQRF